MAAGMVVGLGVAVPPAAPALAVAGAQPIVSGYISSTGGPSSTGNAAVQLKFLDYDAAPNIGDNVPEYVITKVIADAAGNYAISVDPAALPPVVQAAAAANGGAYNFELVVTAKDGRRGYSAIAREVSGGAWLNMAPDEVGGETDLSEALLVQSDAELAGESGGGGAAAATSTAAVGSYCQWNYTSNAIRATALMDVHSSSRTSGEWKYGTSANSTIDITMSYSPTGSGSVAGTRSINNSRGAYVSQTFSGSRHSRAATDFYYRIFTMKADNSSATYCTNYTNRPGSKKVVPISWQGSAYFTGTLSTIACSSSWPSNRRDYYGPGGSLHKSYARTQKIGGAASIGGFSIGAQSTYTKSLTFRLTWSTAGYACGNNADPPYSQYVYVQ